MPDEVWLAPAGKSVTSHILLRKGRCISAGTVTSTVIEGYEGVRIDGILGKVGATRTANRYPIAIAGGHLEDARASFELSCQVGRYYDCALVVLDAFSPDASKLSNGEPIGRYRVILATAQQLSFFNEIATPSIRVRLRNGQVINSVDLAGRQSDGRHNTLELCDLAYVDIVDATKLNSDEITLQAMPSQAFNETIRLSHSYHCVLNPEHKERFGKSHLQVRNLFLEADYPRLHARLVIVPKYSPLVPSHKIVLDASTMLAIGLPHGERMGARPVAGSRPAIRTRIFGYRHSLARVTFAGAEYMEKPLVRLPDLVFDILGIGPGDRVVVESVATTGGGLALRRVKLRALSSREYGPLLRARMQMGVPDYSDIMGMDDLPIMNLDLAAREKLGVTPGSAVYVRPAISSILRRELSALTLLLVAATFSAAALSNFEVAAAAVGICLILVSTVVVARFRG